MLSAVNLGLLVGTVQQFFIQCLKAFRLNEKLQFAKASLRNVVSRAVQESGSFRQSHSLESE